MTQDSIFSDKRNHFCLRTGIHVCKTALTHTHIQMLAHFSLDGDDYEIKDNWQTQGEQALSCDHYTSELVRFCGKNSIWNKGHQAAGAKIARSQVPRPSGCRCNEDKLARSAGLPRLTIYDSATNNETPPRPHRHRPQRHHSHRWHHLPAKYTNN